MIFFVFLVFGIMVIIVNISFIEIGGGEVKIKVVINLVEFKRYLRFFV